MSKLIARVKAIQSHRRRTQRFSLSLSLRRIAHSPNVRSINVSVLFLLSFP